MKQISNKHPNVKITLANYENLITILNQNDDRFSYSQVVRPLVCGILLMEKEWINSNILYEKYSEQLSACFGKFISNITFVRLA